MHEKATLSRIQIHPIKSLPPTEVPHARVLPTGPLEHDRQFALCDDAGRFVTGKRTPKVHRLLCDIDFQERIITLGCRDGEKFVFSLDADRDRLEEWLSDYFEFRVRLMEDAERCFPDDTESSGPTIISRATLAEIASWFPGLTEHDVRLRFRTTLEVDGVPPFWEDRLSGAEGETVTFRIGDVPLAGTNPCRRCVVPTRSAETGDVWPEFLQEFMQRREQCLPPWADRSRFDHFYRLAVNTRVIGRVAGVVAQRSPQHSATGGSLRSTPGTPSSPGTPILRIGDRVVLDGEANS